MLIFILVQCVIILVLVDAKEKVVFKIEVPNFIKHQLHTKVVYLHKYHDHPHDHHGHHHHVSHHGHGHHHGHDHGHGVHHHHAHGHGHDVHHHHPPPKKTTVVHSHHGHGVHHHHAHGHGHDVHHHHAPPKKPTAGHGHHGHDVHHHHHTPPKKPTVVHKHKKPHTHQHYEHGYNHNHHFSISHDHHPEHRHDDIKPGQYKVNSYLTTPTFKSNFNTRVKVGKLLESDSPEKIQEQKIEPVVGNDFDVENIEDEAKSNKYGSENIKEEDDSPETHSSYEVTEDQPTDFGAKFYEHEYEHYKNAEFPLTKHADSGSYSEDYTNPFSVAKYTADIHHGTIDLEENYGPNLPEELDKYVSEFRDFES